MLTKYFISDIYTIDFGQRNQNANASPGFGLKNYMTATLYNGLLFCYMMSLPVTPPNCVQGRIPIRSENSCAPLPSKSRDLDVWTLKGVVQLCLKMCLFKIHLAKGALKTMSFCLYLKWLSPKMLFKDSKMQCFPQIVMQINPSVLCLSLSDFKSLF